MPQSVLLRRTMTLQPRGVRHSSGVAAAKCRPRSFRLTVSARVAAPPKVVVSVCACEEQHVTSRTQAHFVVPAYTCCTVAVAPTVVRFSQHQQLPARLGMHTHQQAYSAPCVVQRWPVQPTHCWSTEDPLPLASATLPLIAPHPLPRLPFLSTPHTTFTHTQCNTQLVNAVHAQLPTS